MNTEQIMPLLFEPLAKGAAILFVAALVVCLWRGASAAQRHLVWFAAIVAVLLLPATRMVTPRWPVQFEQRTKREISSTVFPFAPAPVVLATSGGSVAEAGRPSWEIPDWRKIVVAGWLVGTALLLGWRLIGSWRLIVLKRASRPLRDARVEALAGNVLRHLAIGRRVEIRLSDECRVPMTWGSFRPVLMLPSEALEWSDTRLEGALCHEAGHISRSDYLARWIAQFACAVYWLNPLVWFAAHALRVAQEQATDDIVLRAGTPRDDYAAQLFDAARSVAARGFLARHAVAMASPSTLEGRVLAIVDEKRNRRPLSGWATASASAAVLGALMLGGAAQLSGAEKKAESPKDETPTAEPGAKELQIEIESKFVEITEEAANPAKMSWLPAIPKSGPIRGAFAGVLTEEQAQAAWKTLNQTKGVDLFSAPRVTTRSKQRAIIEIIREFRYPTEWEKDKKPGTWIPETFETKNVGVTLAVEAAVNDGGIIDLDLAPEVVEFLGFKDLDAGGKAVSPGSDPSKPMQDRLMAAPTGIVPSGHRSLPIFFTRKIATTVSVAAGQTVVMELGSADAEQVVEDPGRKGTTKREIAKSRRRLLVFVTAKIINPAIAKKAVTITSDSQTSDKTTGSVTASGNVKIETPQAVIMAKKVEIKPKPAEGAAPASVALENAQKIILPKIEFREATLREAVDFLRKKGVDLDPEHKGVNIVLRGPEKADTKISLSVTDVPLAEAVKYVAGLGGLEVSADPYALTLQPPGAKAVEAPTPAVRVLPAPGTPAAALMERAAKIVIPRLEFRDATLDESVEFLRKKSTELDPEKQGVNIVVRHSKTSPEAQITVSLTNIPLSEALRYVAQLAGLDVSADEHSFVVAAKPAP